MASPYMLHSLNYGTKYHGVSDEFRAENKMGGKCRKFNEFRRLLRFFFNFKVPLSSPSHALSLFNIVALCHRQSVSFLKEKRRGGRKSRRRSGSTVKLSESEEDDEVKEGKEETRKGTQQKKRCREQDEEVSSNVAESSGDEDFIASSRSAKRCFIAL